MLNWNQPEDTLECLHSLLPMAHKGLASILVCDNHSSDDSVKQIQAWAESYFSSALALSTQHPAVFTLIRTDHNAGYAGGNNAGLRFILDYPQFEFIWVLNNDTAVKPDALSKLVEFAHQQPQAGLLGSIIADYHDQTCIQCAGGYQYNPLTTITRPALQGQPLHTANETTIPVDYISGAAMLMRTEAIKKTGLFNQTFFLYYEELDYIQRLKKHGYSIAYCPQSIVYHKGGASTPVPLAHYHENLSTLKYTALHHPRLLPFAALFRLTAKFGLLLIRRQTHLLTSLWQAYRDFFYPGSLCKLKATRSDTVNIQILYQANLP